MSATVFDAHGRRVTLGAELGSGGEGTIRALVGANHDTLVAKLWHAGIAREPPALAAVAVRLEHGWPDVSGHARLVPIEGLIYDEDGRLVGVTLDRLPDGSVELADLLTVGDRHRKRLAATSHWQLRVATRVADIVARAHAAQLVIGDLTPRNFVVDPGRARVTAFDTDAWQLLDGRLAARRITPDALAPEQLRGGAYVPSIEADRWSLAVAVVQILLDGRHPCEGAPPGASVDLPLLEDNVRDGYSHFSSRALRRTLGSPRLAYFSPRVRLLVEEAFGPGQLDPRLRPSARAWVQALRDDDAELVECDRPPTRITRNHRVHPEAECVGCAMIGAGLQDPYAR
jgi:DNA-binding helix-hairpin-helix protein with protein kinase domain